MNWQKEKKSNEVAAAPHPIPRNHRDLSRQRTLRRRMDVSKRARPAPHDVERYALYRFFHALLPVP
jgi:hypothetical protein